MRTSVPGSGELDLQALNFCRQSLDVLQRSEIAFLLGGAYALERYTSIQRHTKNFDFFIHARDARRALDRLAAAGYRTELTFPHWLGKAFQGDLFVHLIFGSGNGLCRVHDHGSPTPRRPKPWGRRCG
jgi:hypothetical protein